MKKKFKILLATDYSEAVMSAERFAVQFAKATESQLIIFHAYDIPLASTPSKPIEFAKKREDFQTSELWSLEQHCEKLFHSLYVSSEDLNCDYIVKEGKAGKEIRTEADKCDADFIVLGTHGVTGFREFFLGSHTWDVIKKSTLPVLAIPKDALFTGLKNIVFATDYREGEMSVIKFLVQFAKQFNSSLTILHVIDNVYSKKEELTLFETFKKEISDKLPYEKMEFRLVHYNDIISGLNEFCMQSKTDLLVLSPEKPFLWENLFSPMTSITRKMAFHTHIPILSIPDYYNTENSKFWDLFELDESYLGEDY